MWETADYFGNSPSVHWDKSTNYHEVIHTPQYVDICSDVWIINYSPQTNTDSRPIGKNIVKMGPNLPMFKDILTFKWYWLINMCVHATDDVLNFVVVQEATIYKANQYCQLVKMLFGCTLKDLKG